MKSKLIIFMISIIISIFILSIEYAAWEDNLGVDGNIQAAEKFIKRVQKNPQNANTQVININSVETGSLTNKLVDERNADIPMNEVEQNSEFE